MGTQGEAHLKAQTAGVKPRRRYMWERLQAGRMEGARIIG